ncbi:hypothetical protein HYV10_01245 [Candidatus Dependentiae bacterium]|nr:hypothetical protein [Candidatus Dependentiae bacterium]
MNIIYISAITCISISLLPCSNNTAPSSQAIQRLHSVTTQEQIPHYSEAEHIKIFRIYGIHTRQDELVYRLGDTERKVTTNTQEFNDIVNRCQGDTQQQKFMQAIYHMAFRNNTNK